MACYKSCMIAGAKHTTDTRKNEIVWMKPQDGVTCIAYTQNVQNVDQCQSIYAAPQETNYPPGAVYLKT